MATPEDRLAAYFDTSQPRGPFNDEQIETIARLLARCSHATEKLAGRSPRTYIVFRTIGQRDLVPRLLSEGFGDDWFPVTSRGLPGFLDPRLRTNVVETQHLILTKSLDLENGQHCNYNSEEQRPYTVHSYIGSGSFGQVRVIESRVTDKRYALKTIRRKLAFGTKSKEIMSVFNAELNIMKRLQHRHVVRYIGSYTDRLDLGLLMSPVADCDLGAYLEKACKTPECHPTLRTFFGCLATALSYLHDRGVKHRDIKPKNVLVYNASVLLADFGISRDFLDTTSGPTTATQRYCSPEVANNEGRNASTDVWSLGCVFLEMQLALQLKDLIWVKAYYEAHGTGLTHYHANPEATLDLLGELRTTILDDMHARPTTWIKDMLTVDRQARPTAAEVTNQITSTDSQVGFLYSCDQCSYPSSEPDSVESTEDVTTDVHHPAQNSENQQVTNAATLEPGSPEMPYDHLPRTPPGGQSSESSLPFRSGAATPVILGHSPGDVDRPTDELLCREVDKTIQKNEDRIERTVDQREDLAKTAVPFGDDFGPRASSPHVVVEPRTTSGIDESTIASSCSKASTAALGSIAVSSTDRIPRGVFASPGGSGGSNIQDLNTEMDGFCKGPYAFRIINFGNEVVVTWNALVPNIVVGCTKSILKTRSR